MKMVGKRDELLPVFWTQTAISGQVFLQCRRRDRNVCQCLGPCKKKTHTRNKFSSLPAKTQPLLLLLHSTQKRMKISIFNSKHWILKKKIQPRCFHTSSGSSGRVARKTKPVRRGYLYASHLKAMTIPDAACCAISPYGGGNCQYSEMEGMHFMTFRMLCFLLQWARQQGKRARQAHVREGLSHDECALGLPQLSVRSGVQTELWAQCYLRSETSCRTWGIWPRQ